MVILFIEQAKIPVSRYNLRKFYALSKKPVVQEQAETVNKRSGAYFNLDLDEMIEFIWRIAQYVYSPESYGIEPKPPTAASAARSTESPSKLKEEEGEAAGPDVPDVISCMFYKTPF